MDKFFPVYTLKNECHDCYKCVRECNVKAIKIENGHAQVLGEKCVACGACVKACPSGAKKVRFDVEKVKGMLLNSEKVAVSLAPSWVGAFDFDKGKMIAILKKLGFAFASETALGAQEVSIECAKILKSTKDKLVISSACPVIVSFVQKYKPEFAKYITPIASPALTHAKMLKNIYGDDLKVVFIGPCIGKKNESDEHQELISAALTFEELKFWISEEFIDVEKVVFNSETDIFLPKISNEGALYPIEGGMNQTIKMINPNLDVHFLNISSLSAFEKSLENLDVEKLDKTVFLEALACEGGCVDGPCVAKKKPNILVTTEILSNFQKRDKIESEPEVKVEINYLPKTVNKERFSIEQILQAMKKIGKTSEEDELNCQGCGYKTCRDLACALLAGDAEPSMCISYMRKIAMQKAAAMLRCMPQAIVMVDNELKIVETNQAFLKMFCDEESFEIFSSNQGLINGASLEKIVDFTDVFKKTLKTGKDIIKERYPYKERLYDIAAFTIEKGQLAGAIIQDVTKNEINREKISNRAQEVISKNIAIVQEIACLLGEHMVETELLLSTIANDFDDSKKDEK